MAKKRPDDRLYDVRIRERFIERGTLSRKDLDSHLSKLPDVADKGEVMEIDLKASEGGPKR